MKKDVGSKLDLIYQ